MTQAHRIVAIIVAAGTGVRAGGSVPKQFAPIAGRPMIAYSYDAFSAHPAIAEAIVIIGEGQQALAAASLGSSVMQTTLTDGQGKIHVKGAPTKSRMIAQGLSDDSIAARRSFGCFHRSTKPGTGRVERPII